MAQLTIRELVKTFPAPAGSLTVLNGISLELARGDQLAIVGPSGCGKSTLLHIMGTLDEPTRGDVLIDDQNPFALPPPALARFRNQRIGFIFQDHCLLPQLTALENVLLPVLGQRNVLSDDLRRGQELLDRVELLPRAAHRPSELSGGERQRVAVARALICEPSLLLADEPTGSLDETNARSVGDLLLDISRQMGTILICVTHSATLAERFPRRAQLTAGNLVESQ